MAFRAQDVVPFPFRRHQISMAYFSSKSTWLSLVEGPDAWSHHADGQTLSFQDYRPGILSPMVPSGSGEGDADGGDEAMGQIDQEQLRLTRELRHRLFFQHSEWEFGPALLGDLLQLARSEADSEE